MRTKLNKEGQANHATTHGRGWLALFTAALALAITFTLNACGGSSPPLTAPAVAYKSEAGPVYFGTVWVGDDGKMPNYKTTDFPDGSGKVYTEVEKSTRPTGYINKTVKMPDGKVWTVYNIPLSTYEDAKKYCSNLWSSIPEISMKEKLSELVKEEWHLSTKEEWDALINSVGGSSTAGRFLKHDREAYWADYHVGTSCKGGEEWKWTCRMDNKGAITQYYKRGTGEDKYGFGATSTEPSRKTGLWWAYSSTNADSVFVYSMENKSSEVKRMHFPAKGNMASARCVQGPAPTPAPVPVPAKQEAVPEAVPAQPEAPEAGESQ
ncbi:MAG: fibrobacter succinogenes major paralogous domain-containing protein [Fibromonadaceae bacterium]|nr:fibrobacter succinogenes major paralogous domain-containing protein [Fibromonadaceae bacterium]